MKEIIKLTIQSASEKLSLCTRSFQYELFGYDFMLDTAFALWLIEINTNPCLEESSPLLAKLIPRLLSTACSLN
jgi:tubulin--tyrosine ligase/tubulin polyglutamylase TTLL9